MAKRRQKAAQQESNATHPLKIHLDETSDFIKFGRRVPGVDTCQGISDDVIALALCEQPLLLYTAKHLSESLGRVICREDLAARIEASPRLQNVHRVADQIRLARAAAIQAQHADAEHNRELAREARHRRNDGPRCGARTRSARPCQRKPVLYKDRCPNHGGLSTGPKTPEGKARSAEGRRQRWARRRARK